MRRTSARGGFTLAELMVAIAITVIIVALFGSIFSGITNAAGRANQRIDSFRDARSALQMIQRDLAAVVHVPSSAYLLFTNQTYADPASTKCAQIFALSAIKNQPAGSLPPAPGDICAVGYYCSWQGNHYTLRRYFRDSAATFGFFKSGGAGAYVSPMTLYAPGATDEVVASYIWNLTTTAYNSDGTVNTSFPLEVNVSANNEPAAVEVAFSAISSSAARTITAVSTNPDDWMDTSSINYRRLIAPHVYQFRTRVTLP